MIVSFILALTTIPERANPSSVADVGSYSYGVTHAMKPQRMRITHELVSAYDMLPRMHVLVSHSNDLLAHHPVTRRSVPNARLQKS